MMETLAQHPPAMKVGGRRLSTTARPKPQVPQVAETRKTPPPASTPPDYPRPAAPTLSSDSSEPPHAPEREREHEHAYQQQEDDAPHKKKQGGGGGGGSDEHERRLRESALRKAEQNRPTRDFQATPKVVGAGGRIGQPAGKSFGV